MKSRELTVDGLDGEGEAACEIEIELDSISTSSFGESSYAELYAENGYKEGWVRGEVWNPRRQTNLWFFLIACYDRGTEHVRTAANCRFDQVHIPELIGDRGSG